VPSERVNKAVSYLLQGNAELGALKAMGLTADELNEVLATVPWGYRTTPRMKDAVQNLYEQRRAEEAEARAAPGQARMIRLTVWNLVFVIIGAFFAGIAAAVAGFMAWKQLHP